MAKIERCQSCNTWHQGFHLCLGRVWDEHEPGTLLTTEPAEKVGRGKAIRTTEHNQNMSESIRSLWADRHAKTLVRDLKICRLYEEKGLSYRDIAETLKMDGDGELTRNQIRTVLRRMEVSLTNHRKKD